MAAIREVGDGSNTLQGPSVKPILYIIMRNDLASLNAGKAMAQAAHAANALAHKMVKLRDASPVKKLYLKWAKETSQGFGTTIVLAGTVRGFEEATQYIENDGGLSFRGEAYAFGVIHDPTYPLRDGSYTHLIPVDTCAYLLADKDSEAAKVLSGFELHP